MKKGLILTLLVAVLTIGGFLRLYQINEQSLWLDEGITYYNSGAEDLRGVWERTAALDQSPPGYYFLMHEYLEFFDESEFGFRLIALVFGVLTILFVYLLFSEMFRREVGLLAAALLAINPFHIGFSLEARMYGPLALEAVMAFYFLYKAMAARRGGAIWWILFSLISVAGVYTHNFFMFVLLALGFVFLVLLPLAERMSMKWLGMLLSGAFIIFAYLPWVPRLLEQLKVERYWMGENTIWDLKDYFMDFANDNKYVFLGLMGLCVIGFLWSLFRRKGAGSTRGLFSMFALVIFLLVAVMVPLVFSLLGEPILKIRYVLYALPLWLGFAAVGLYALQRWHFIFPMMAIATATYFWMPWQVSAYPMEFGEDFRELVETVKENPAPMIVHTPSAAHIINFYTQNAFPVKPFPATDDLREFNIDERQRFKFYDLIRDYPSFYLVITHTHEAEKNLMAEWAWQICDVSRSLKKIEGMEVYHFSQCK